MSLEPDQALRVILERTKPLAPETIRLETALDRFLHTPALADADSPRFDASAMDGYAARQADLNEPVKVIGEVQAGAENTVTLQTGECARIFTGAPVPAGADCVIKQEDVTREGDLVRVQRRDSTSHIRRRGENRRAGDVLVPAGTKLGPAEVAALASGGIVQPVVFAQPRCVHLLTGNELVDAGDTPVGAQIRDSNSPLIAGLLLRHGAQRAAVVRVRDDLKVAVAAAEKFPEHEVLLVSGGASVGDHDFARPLLRQLGYELHFEKLNLRPGRPLVFATRGSHYAFALPGNPVSHWVTFQLFVAPLLRKLQTGRDEPAARLLGQLAAGSKLPPPDARRTYWPCRATPVDGRFELTPLPLASSGDGLGLVGANALLPLLPDNTLDLAQPVEFILCS